MLSKGHTAYALDQTVLHQHSWLQCCMYIFPISQRLARATASDTCPAQGSWTCVLRSGAQRFSAKHSRPVCRPALDRCPVPSRPAANHPGMRWPDLASIAASWHNNKLESSLSRTRARSNWQLRSEDLARRAGCRMQPSKQAGKARNTTGTRERERPWSLGRQGSATPCRHARAPSSG